MAKKNTGREFELFVKFLQETLANDSATDVKHNVRLKANTGRPRQFDVIITTVVNKIIICIAIECKDHNRRVSADKIDGFVAKCDSVKSIHRKVFVSKKGFQKTAIDVAKSHGVSLYTFDDIDRDTLQEWVSDFGLEMNDLELKVLQVRLTFCKRLPYAVDGDSIIINRSSTGAGSITMNELVQHEWDRFLPDCKKSMWELYDRLGTNSSVPASIKMPFIGNFKRTGWYIELGTDKLYLDSLVFEIEATPIKVQLEPKVAKGYRELDQLYHQGRLLNYNLLDLDAIQLTVIPLENDSKFSRLFITNSKGENIFGDGTFLIPKGLKIDFMRPMKEETD